MVLQRPFPVSESREPVQVTRAVPIPTTPNNPPGYSTQELNEKYRALLKEDGVGKLPIDCDASGH